MTLSAPYKYLLAVLVPLLVLLVHSYYYYPFFVDDAYISLRYAQRLVEGKGLTWNDGYYVEGYSNFLWVLLVSALGWIGFDLVAAARAICLLSSVATMLAFARYVERYADGKAGTLFLANIAFAFTAPVAVWSIGGLEGTLIMALLSWALVLGLPLTEAPNMKRAAYAGVLLGLAAITRPEGAFFTVMLAGGIWLFTPLPREIMLRPLALMCIVAASFFAMQLGFRLYYYGEWMPNTYYAKVSGVTYARLLSGYMYCIKATASFLPLLLVVCLQFDKLLKPQNRSRKQVVYICLLAIIGWLAALTMAGGDMEPSYRHILPLVPFFIIMVIEAISIDQSASKNMPQSARKNMIFYGYLFMCFLWLQHSMEENDKHFYAAWEVKAMELGKWLNDNYHETQPLIAVTHAGAIPYYSKLPTIDTLGLNDLYLTKHRSPLFGHGLLGHELFDAKYVMSRKPDAVILFTGRRDWLYSHELVTNPEFRRSYKEVEVKLPSYTPTIWVRRDSKKLVIR
jgi:hypothetical protein